MLPECQCKAVLALDPCCFRRALTFTAFFLGFTMEVCAEPIPASSVMWSCFGCAGLCDGLCGNGLMTPIKALQR